MRLTVSWNCSPGSPQRWAAVEICRQISRAGISRSTSPLVTARSPQIASSSTACMKSSVTRMLWLAFWKNTEA